MRSYPGNKLPGSSDDRNEGDGSFFPTILLASDDARAAEAFRLKLSKEGFTITLAAGYPGLEGMWQQHRHAIILLDVVSARSVDAAVDMALNIKRHDPSQFVGYLADPILRTSGLAGDAIFPRSANLLPQLLRTHFTPRTA
jgi:hypothetical protein